MTMEDKRFTIVTNTCAGICLTVSAALAAFSCNVTAAETLPLTAVNRANEVIDQSIAAYGGAEALANLNTLLREREFTTWATNQSLRPGPPWDEGSQTNIAAIDFEKRNFFAVQEGSGGGFDFNAVFILRDEEAWNVDHRAKTITQLAQANFDNSAGPLIRVTAPLLVKELINRRHTSHWLGTVDFEGRPHDIITLVMEAGPALSLYFDQETHLLSRSERVLPPFGQVDYRFVNYAQIDGIPFATQLKLYANDEPNLYINNLRTEVNQPIETLAGMPESYVKLENTPQPTEVALNEVSEGVFLIGASGTYALFIETGETVIAVGATAGIEERIATLREAGITKPIQHAVLTHHHNDHLVGVPAYESQGATLYTVAENEAVVRANAADGDALPLIFVEDRYVLESGDRVVEILDLGPTPHVDHLLVAWLPEEGLLFEADHFPNPANGEMPPAQPVTRALAAAIDARNLDVQMIVGAHSPRVASMGDLRTSVERGATLKTAAH